MSNKYYAYLFVIYTHKTDDRLKITLKYIFNVENAHKFIEYR